MKTYKEEVAESHQSTFNDAIERETAEDDRQVAVATVPQVEAPVDLDDFDIVVGEVEPEPEKPKEDTTNEHKRICKWCHQTIDD